MRIVFPKRWDVLIGAPLGWVPSRDGDCSTLPVQYVWFMEPNSPDPRHIGQKSFWRPTPEELAILNAGGAVTLTVVGPAHPVVQMGAEHVEEEKLPKEVFGG